MDWLFASWSPKQWPLDTGNAFLTPMMSKRVSGYRHSFLLCGVLQYLEMQKSFILACRAILLVTAVKLTSVAKNSTTISDRTLELIDLGPDWLQLLRGHHRL